MRSKREVSDGILSITGSARADSSRGWGGYWTECRDGPRRRSDSRRRNNLSRPNFTEMEYVSLESKLAVIPRIKYLYF